MTSNPSFATLVPSGNTGAIVTGVAPGTATITASGGFSSASATVSVGTWDLTTDWSDALNPFGPNFVWSLYEAPQSVFTVNQPDYWRDGRNQRAWAAAPFPQTGYIPYWMKVTSLSSCGNCANAGPNPGGPLYAGFVTAGTVVVSTAESTPGPASVGWTSPGSGQATISGGVWLNKNLGSRPQRWELFLNGALLTSGSLSDGDPYTQSNPFVFASGSGGASAVSFAVRAGDQVLLSLSRLAANGSNVAVVFRVSLTP